MTQLMTQSEAPAALTYRTVRRKPRRWWIPALFILGPTVLMTLYVFVLATPMYVSETRFAIRASEPMGDAKQGGGLASFGAMAAFSADGFATREFIASSDALASLNAAGNYVKRMSVGSRDPINALPENPDSEQLLKFFLHNLDVRFSLTEQIITLRMRAYTPQDARELTAAMVDITEQFTNRMNERARNDALALARQEVAISEERVVKVRKSLNEWRLRYSDIDPAKSIEVGQAVITQLRKDLGQVQSELASISVQLDPRSQRRRVYEDRIKALTQQIEAEQAKLTGQSGSTAQAMVEYERLTVEQEFATRQLNSAQQLLEQARMSLVRQSKYIAVIVQAATPRLPAYPEPFKYIGITFAISALLYAVLSLILRMALDSMR